MFRFAFLALLMPGLAGFAFPEEKAITPAEAAKMVDKNCLVEMKVASVGLDKNKVNVFLNSKESYKDKDNFTILLKGTMAKTLKETLKYEDPVEYFKDKTIRVEGKVTLFRESPQIVVEKADKLSVVPSPEKKN
ncbi:MAG: hypothetical protein EXR99_14100 [Gemmataceae bacterium]|nr:hypothetical protein [Gemmataceae bacterium]